MGKLVLFALLAVSATAPAQHVTAQPRVVSWRYQTSKDPLTDKVTTVAVLSSRNVVRLGFPYGGPVIGRITVRLDEDRKPEIVFQVNKGQFLCPADTCEMNTRIDDGPVESYGCEVAADGNSKTMFLGEYYSSDLLPKLSSGKRLRIAADFYQDTSRTFEFLPAGLDLARLK